MNPTLTAILVLGMTLAMPSLAQQPGIDNPSPFNAFSNGVLPTSAPGSSTGWSAVDAFPNLQFVDPLCLRQIPGTADLPMGDQGELLLVGKDGQIFRFDNDETVTQAQVVPVLDLRTETQTGEDMGFYGLVFHPNFGQSGQIGEDDVFVCYNHDPNLTGAGINDSYWRVSRFNWNSGTGTILAGSEEVLISQYDPQQWHNGGAMFFDNEGFLNVTCGDGEFDYWHQDTNGPIDGGFFGGIFRIDVDYLEALAADPSYNKSHAIRRQPLDIPTGGMALPAGWPASFSQGYGIPETNPWNDPAGTVLEEFIIHGLRSPHTAHYDPVENEIWVGDVGGGQREEISRFVIGDNGQWPIREGINGGAEPAGAIGTWTPPIYDYTRAGADQYGVTGACIIGGMRYRGAKWNSVFPGNTVIFGDITQGKAWTVNLDPSGNFDSVTLLIDGIQQGGKQGIANFFTDDAGEIYLLEVNGTNNNGGKIKKLVTQGITAEPPQFLSQTGLFSNLSTLTPSSGVLPYDVETPLWSDEAHKLRWIAVPNNGTHNSAAEQIIFDEEFNWVFPEGSVLIKHFELDTDLDPSIENIKRLETRLIICTADGGKYGVTYKWNPAGTDAELLVTGDSEAIPMTDNGAAAPAQNWDFPSRADCLQCHTSQSGQALGLRTTPLNRDFHYPSTGRDANQLFTMNSLGMFDQALTTTELENFIESRSIDDESAPVEHRVRSYLDSNCSHCHQPGGTVDYFDTRLGTPLHGQGLVNGIIQGHFNLPGGNYIKPGDSSLSAIYVRTHAVGNGDAMPPLAKNLIDQEAVDLIDDYILSLTAAEFQSNGATQARYVRLTGTSSANGEVWGGAAEFTILDGAGLPITTGVSVDDFDSEEPTGEGANNGHAIHAIDNNPNTFWHTQWQALNDPYPHHLTLDLGSLRDIGGYHYIPRQGNSNSRIGDYQVHYSSDGTNWTLMDSGSWPDTGDTKVFESLVALRKARCEIAAPLGTLSGDFEVTIAFDMDVDDFTSGDLQITGGSVTALRGSGYYYVATVSPSASNVTISVPADSANTALEGSFASNTLDLGDDIFGPVATFNNLPSGPVGGALILDIEFDEEPFGFTIASLSAINANLIDLNGSGTSYTVIVDPISEGSFSVTLSNSGIVDALGNPMADPNTAHLTFTQSSLYAEAEDGVLSGGMVIANDGAASGGSYVWLPEGTDPGNENSFDDTNSATYTFEVPHDGDWNLEGLVLANSDTSDSFWFKVNSGDVLSWDIDETISTYHWDAANHYGGSVGGSPTTLIDAATNNGSFELLGGGPSAAKATHWDTDPDGDVDNWTNLSGTFNDSGTEVNGDATDGTRIAFFQNGNSTFNETSHLIIEGDLFTYSWDYTLDGRGEVTAQLAYRDGANIIPISGTDTANPNDATVHLGLGTSWVVPTAHPAIGFPMVIMLTANGIYPHVDNVELTVEPTSIVIDPLILNLTAGTHTVTIYGREDGTRLDALRLVSARPQVALTAPATSANTAFAINIDFTQSVTGLVSGDFIVTGATVDSLTGSGAVYSLSVTPTAANVAVQLPADSTVNGSGDPNYESNLALTIIDSPTLFEQWATSHGLGTVAYLDDPNDDGIFVLTEFLLNLDPNTIGGPIFDPLAGPVGLPLITLVDAGGGTSKLRVEFPLNSAAVAEGYQYIAQFSNGLSGWNDVTIGTSSPLGGGWEHFTIDDSETTLSELQRFARLKVLPPE